MNWHQIHIIFLLHCPMGDYYEQLDYQIRKIVINYGVKSHWWGKISIDVYQKWDKWYRKGWCWKSWKCLITHILTELLLSRIILSNKYGKKHLGITALENLLRTTVFFLVLVLFMKYFTVWKTYPQTSFSNCSILSYLFICHLSVYLRILVLLYSKL